MCLEVWLKLKKKNSLLICHNNPIFIKDLDRKRQEDLLSQKMLNMRVKVIGSIFTSLRQCYIADWCIAEREAPGFKLLQTAFPHWIFTASWVGTSSFKECTTWALSNDCWRTKYPCCKWGAFGDPLCTPSVFILPQGGKPLCSHTTSTQSKFLSKKNPSYTLHAKSVMEMYQEIVSGPKWWSCGFFLIHWYDSFYAYYWWLHYKIIFWQRCIVSGNFSGSYLLP